MTNDLRWVTKSICHIVSSKKKITSLYLWGSTNAHLYNEDISHWNKEVLCLLIFKRNNFLICYPADKDIRLHIHSLTSHHKLVSFQPGWNPSPAPLNSKAHLPRGSSTVTHKKHTESFLPSSTPWHKCFFLICFLLQVFFFPSILCTRPPSHCTFFSIVILLWLLPVFTTNSDLERSKSTSCGFNPCILHMNLACTDVAVISASLSFPFLPFLNTFPQGDWCQYYSSSL